MGGQSLFNKGNTKIDGQLRVADGSIEDPTQKKINLRGKPSSNDISKGETERETAPSSESAQCMQQRGSRSGSKVAALKGPAQGQYPRHIQLKKEKVFAKDKRKNLLDG